ncbi:hypothetical protein FB451DRAFT_1279459 [Mycena latifolia]|nr:hypothetical protein FB451DRAFT_1279459 [Mycena latifolia]
MPVELSPSVEKALSAFEDGARKNVDCQSLLEDSFHTFGLLERWETAESNVSSVMSIIKRVRRQGRAYFETLDDSIFVAKSLYELAQDAKQLASSLLDPAHKPQEIQEFIAEMRTYTQAALEKSKRISAGLREVRKGINQISDSIPGEMAKLERQERRIVAKNEALERRIGHARVAKTVGTAALAIVGGVSMIAFPPMMLILPVGLPIAILVLEAYEQRTSKALMKRHDEIWDCRAGLQELQNVTVCLAGFAKHVDSLTDFWLRSDTMLETISNGVHRIRGNTARIRLKATMDLWQEAAELYLNYASKLQRIQKIDCGATSSLRSRNSSSSGRDRFSGSGKDSDQHDQKKTTTMDLKRRNAISTRSRSSSNGSSSSSRHSSR